MSQSLLNWQIGISKLLYMQPISGLGIRSFNSLARVIKLLLFVPCYFFNIQHEITDFLLFTGWLVLSLWITKDNLNQILVVSFTSS
jgi:hypothetical protein